MDVRRKIAEYDEAKNEYELKTQMLHTMQEAYAKGQVNLTKPLVPITIHMNKLKSQQAHGVRTGLTSG